MTKIFSDPFATYGAIADLTASGWSATNCTYNASGGRFAGHGSVVAQTSALLTKGFAAINAGDSVFLQFAIKWLAGTRSLTCVLARFGNNSGVDICATIRRAPNDAIQVYDANTMLAGASAGGVLISDVWHVICVKAKIGDGATGTCDVYVNDMATPLLALTGLDLNGPGAANGCDFVGIESTVVGVNNVVGHLWNMSEPFIWSSTGGGVWGSPIGDKKHISLLPTSDSAAAWTENGGGPAGRFEKVNDTLGALHDADGTYNSTALAAVVDEFGLENTPAGASGIIGVLSMISHKKSDGGAPPGTLNHRIYSNATAALIPCAVPTVIYANDFAQFDLDPNGNIAWTPGAVDALKAGYSNP